jgi:hypothetical protein
MFQKLPYLVLAFILLYVQCNAQNITYSDFEKKDFNQFKFDVIAKHNNHILVYKATYAESPYRVQDVRIISSPNTSIFESAICIYDLQMKMLQRIMLPLPERISGVHFLVYENFFYLFYQYQRGRTIYCMAAKIDMEGKIIGKPFEMDKTVIVDTRYQSQIYSVINSENKKHIVVFKIAQLGESGSVLTRFLFNDSLRIVSKSSNPIQIAGSKYLTEFKVDNDGNFVFIGLSQSLEKQNATKAVFFKLQPGSNNISYHYIIPTEMYADFIRLTVDNNNKKYILVSFYSNTTDGNITGLHCIIRDAIHDKDISVTNTVFGDSVRQLINKNFITAFNNYYLQDIRLREDGGFIIQAQELTSFPYVPVIDRWNYLQYLPEQIAMNFIFYDAYEYDHYYPWKEWRYTDGRGRNLSFYSNKSLVMAFGPAGLIEWINTINTSQKNIFHATIGYKTIVANNLVYLLFNETIGNKVFLTAQSINGGGEINTDPRLKEDLDLKQQNSSYTHFPRFAKQVSANEIIFPCRNTQGFICLAKVEF